MHHQVVCAVVGPGELLCGTPLQQMLCDYHGETLSLLCCAPNAKPLVLLGCPWASPCDSFPGWAVAQHSTGSLGQQKQRRKESGTKSVWCWLPEAEIVFVADHRAPYTPEHVLLSCLLMGKTFFWKPKCVTSFSMNSDA